ncbi:ATP-binding protein [Psychroserpens sp. MEBiC05023]
MSHEIRTPIHAISGMTNALLRKNHPSTQNNYLEAMKNSSENLLILINDILDISKIESGIINIELQPTDPCLVLDKVINMLKIKANEKGIKLTSQYSKDIPNQIITDDSRLHQILTNLIGNAIKFTSKGLVNIDLSASNNSIIYTINDTGIGISKDKLKTIFNPFEQGEKTKSQIYGGTGLGLSISKKLTDLLHGEIWVESTPNIGSTFFLKLPITQENITTIADKSKQLIAFDDICQHLKELNILLVDDDEFNIMVAKDDFSYYLKSPKIIEANNGKEAFELYKSNTVDLILMDVHMPIMDGLEATKMIRSYEKETHNKHTPIIVMTANVMTSEIERYLDYDIEDYITKPYDPELLIRKSYHVIKNT